MEDSPSLKQLPSIEKLVSSPELSSWENKLIHPVRVRLAQDLVGECREALKGGKDSPFPSDLVKELQKRYERIYSTQIRKVINATGVVLHTNLGRAPLGTRFMEESVKVLEGYCSLEFDLEKGDRGSRTGSIENFLKLYCGVPAALVVNNCAAAVFLILHTLARGKEVILSRGELVQIGGGFRIPDIMEAGGATLVEVGTTNMTHVEDYEKEIRPQTALILKVHQSNFIQSGHTNSPSVKELSKMAASHGIPFVFDLGSGALDKVAISGVLDKVGIDEPTVNEVLRQKVSLVCFSGDKLLGGPQAGIILGERGLVEQMRKSPLNRVLRPGKNELFLLEKTLHAFVIGEQNTAQKILALTADDMKKRSETFLEEIKPFVEHAKIVEGKSPVGGGTSPAYELRTFLVELSSPDSEKIARELLRGEPPVVVRKEKKKLLIDLRTVFPKEEIVLLRRLREALS